jgi:hypothetical protein
MKIGSKEVPTELVLAGGAGAIGLFLFITKGKPSDTVDVTQPSAETLAQELSQRFGQFQTDMQQYLEDLLSQQQTSTPVSPVEPVTPQPIPITPPPGTTTGEVLPGGTFIPGPIAVESPVTPIEAYHPGPTASPRRYYEPLAKPSGPVSGPVYSPVYLPSVPEPAPIVSLPPSVLNPSMIERPYRAPTPVKIQPAPVPKMPKNYTQFGSEPGPASTPFPLGPSEPLEPGLTMGRQPVTKPKTTSKKIEPVSKTPIVPSRPSSITGTRSTPATVKLPKATSGVSKKGLIAGGAGYGDLVGLDLDRLNNL